MSIEEDIGAMQTHTSNARSVLDKATSSYLLVFYGKKKSIDSFHQSSSCCVFTDPSAESLEKLFQDVQSLLNQDISSENMNNNVVQRDTCCVRGIHFVDYDFHQLPSNIGAVFPDVRQCSFYQCPNFDSFQSTLEQFPALTTIAARDCPSLTSLTSLYFIPDDIHLQAIRINNCGLIVEHQNDWEKGLKSLGKHGLGNASSGLVLNITNCKHLKRLPSSIHYLRNVLSCLRLESNERLHYLPQSIGLLSRMVEFQLIHCPNIYALPTSMSRLRHDCKVSITGNEKLVRKIHNDLFFSQVQHWEKSMATNSDNEEMSDNDRSSTCPKTASRRVSLDLSYYSEKVQKMKAYYNQSRIRQFKATVDLTILLRRAKFRAIHRIYLPPDLGQQGGHGYYRCLERFDSMRQLLDDE